MKLNPCLKLSRVTPHAVPSITFSFSLLTLLFSVTLYICLSLHPETHLTRAAYVSMKQQPVLATSLPDNTERSLGIDASP